MSKIIKIGAACAALAAAVAVSFLVRSSVDSLDETTENDIPIIKVGKNKTLPDNITVFSDENTPSSDITPAMWKVTAPDGKSLYMLGTMHALTEDCYPLPDYIKTAFDESDKLSCEINNVDTSLFVFDSQDYTPQPELPQGDTLSAHLTSEQYELLSRYLSDHGKDIVEYDGYAPWYVYENALNTVKTENQADSTTISATIGIDRVLQISANLADKEILSLETDEAKQTVFSSMPEDVMGAVIEQYCGKGDSGLANDLSRCFEAWKSGDLDTIETVAYDTGYVSESSVPLLEKYNELFIIDRNRIMTDKIEEYLSGEPKVFVIAGTAHFVGEKGIPALLEADGYTVERVN